MGDTPPLQESVTFRRNDSLVGVEIMDVEWSPRNWRVFNTDFSAVLIRNWYGEVHYRGRRHVVKPGLGFYSEPGETHSTPRVERAGCFKVFLFAPGLFHEYLRDHEIRGEQAHLTKAVSTMSLPLAKSLLALSRGYDAVQSPLRLQSCFTDIVAAMANDLVERRHSTKAHGETGSRVAERIRECLDEDRSGMNLTTLAKETGLSRFQVVRTFKRRYGMPPHAYQLALHLARARGLLLEGLAPATVAADCGFVDQSHFIRHFKQRFGVTPSGYISACRGRPPRQAAQRRRQSLAGNSVLLL
jgi:AraC-like DNA-binding protein